MADWYNETLYPEYGQRFRVERVLFEDRSEHQHVVVFENSRMGRILALDGVIQVTERDEFFYHEMMVHVPILAHGQAKDVLIIGGGDGGILREVLRHDSVRRATQVEIDRTVVDMCVEYMPQVSAGAYDNPRTELIIQDAFVFAKETDRQQQYDVIISDTTDPIGPGEALFTQDFYASCKQCLKPGGVFVSQNGVPFHQLDELQNTHQRLGNIYQDASFYLTPVPTYVGGQMALSWASDNPELRRVAVEALRERYKAAQLTTKYYSPEIHKAAFVLPPYMLAALKG